MNIKGKAGQLTVFNEGMKAKAGTDARTNTVDVHVLVILRSYNNEIC